MHMIVNHNTPEEFIVATGETHSVRDLCEKVFSKLDMNYEDYIVQNPKYMRPEELKYLRGDSSKAREVLGWQPEYTFDSMLEEMIERWEREL
jgi:GDPmannose 4,6-dehydratase